MKTLLVLAVLGSIACMEDRYSKSELETHAAEFATKLGYDKAKVACVTRDSDSNGYVTCTIFLGDGQEIPLECTIFKKEEGCKKKDQ